MKNILIAIAGWLLLSSPKLYAQTVKLGNYELEAVSVSLSKENLMGKEVVKLTKDSTVKKVDEPTFARLKGVDFTNGTIEVKGVEQTAEIRAGFCKRFYRHCFPYQRQQYKV